MTTTAPTSSTMQATPAPAVRSVDDVFTRLTIELGDALGVLITELGLRTGIWESLRGAGPLSASELATRTGIPAPLLREWLRSQAAAGYLEHDPAVERFVLPDAVATALLDAPGGRTVSACTELLRSMLDSFDELVASYRTDDGYGWDRRDQHHWQGTDALTRAQLPPEIIAAAVRAALAGSEHDGHGPVLDVGCGFGYPTRVIASVLPQSRVIGIDYHASSIAEANRLALTGAGGPRPTFQVAAATDPPGSGYRLVTFFDSLHDLGDPSAALRSARAVLAPDGAVLVCEADAADTVAANLNPVGRMYYAVSALVCTPNALSQRGHAASDEPLGTFAGIAQLTAVAHRAGFSRVRRLPVAGAQQLFLDLRP